MTQGFRSLRVLSLLVLLAGATPLAAQSDIAIRIMPPNRAQFLQGQKFDIRVEASTGGSNNITSLRVFLDDQEITTDGTVDAGAGALRNWTLRNTSLSLAGSRTIKVECIGYNSTGVIVGNATVTVGVRAWAQPGAAAIAGGLDDRYFPDGRAEAKAGPAEEADVEQLHLGVIHPAFFRYPSARESAALPRARNVILLIGDGMGIAHRTAGRVLSKGYKGGKANGTMAMDRFPFNGMLNTSSLNSLITDSAPSAHSYSTGNKGNNGMEGVLPDNTADDNDNPKIEHLSEFITRNFGKATGIISDAFATDATLAAFLAHTSDRGDGTLIASQYFDKRSATGLKVLMGGGSYFFIPKSAPGSRRTDERDVIGAFKGAGYGYVSTATELAAYQPGPNAQLLGLFNIDNMNVAYDKLGLGDPSMLTGYPDQPFLKDMAAKAIDVLKQYPNGFFLMVEGAHIDKQAHRMDAERSIYDVIQFDQAVQVALDFAIATNTDDDPDNDTLVIVTADHECSGMVLPGIARPEKKGTRDYVKTYNYSDGVVRNDSKTSNFTDYVDANGDGYPDNPNAAHKLIVNFGANSDRYEDWQPNSKQKDPGVVVNNVVVANPNDPKKATGVLIPGVIENGSAGGDLETQAVHTLSDIPISAYGPGASQFGRVQDNTEVFFDIMNSMLGSYPIPTQF
jgi:alkaline phosphatase